MFLKYLQCMKLSRLNFAKDLVFGLTHAINSSPLYILCHRNWAVPFLFRYQAIVGLNQGHVTV
jgi:hypothetical protein